MRVSFWGVRGSMPAADRDTCRYGGNTPCLEVRAGEQLLILDAGTGLRELGRTLLSELVTPGLAADVLLTHYHWDHVQGLPFFEPLFQPGNSFRFLGPRWAEQGGKENGGVRGAFAALFAPPFFPVPADKLPAACRFQELDWVNDFTLGEVHVRTCRTNHPQGALAYRLEHEGVAIVYATDHEPGNADADLALRQLARGAQLLITDAQYDPEDLRAAKAGWGHGSWEAAAQLARDAGVKNLVLFHHDPRRLDHELDDVLLRARTVFPRTFAAQEGMHFELESSDTQLWARRSRLGQRVPLPLAVQVEASEAGSRIRHDARLENLSFQGAYLLSARHYDLEQPIEIVLPIATNGHTAAGASPAHEVRLRGNVTRIQPLTTNGGWAGVGISFAEPSRIDAVAVPTDRPGPSREN